MATQLLSAVSSILKEDLLPEVRDQANSSTVIYTRIEKDSDNVRADGRDFTAVIPLQVAHNQGVGYRAEGGTLPGYGSASYDQTEVPLKRGYGRGAIDGALFSVGDAKAVANAIDMEMKSLMRTLRVDSARIAFGDGAGVVGRVNGDVSTDADIVVDGAPFGYFEPGMVLDVWDAKTGGSQEVNSIAISSVDRANLTLTMASAVSCSDDSFIFREDSRALEPMGLSGIVDDGTLVSTFQNLARATNPFWQANIKTVSGALTLDKITQGYQETGIVAGVDPTLILSDHESQRWYAYLLDAKRDIVNKLELDGGFTGLEFAAGGRPIPWVSDRFMYGDKIWFLHEPDITMFMIDDWDWMDEDGGKFHRIQGKDQYEFVAYKYWQLGVGRCNSQTELTGYTTPIT